jgi:hypothetical protein
MRAFAALAAEPDPSLPGHFVVGHFGRTPPALAMQARGLKARLN